jgi:hypothetical protein
VDLLASRVAHDTLNSLLPSLFEAQAGQRRIGVLSDDVLASLAREVLGEINRPLNEHVSRNALSFCRPDPPLLYPQTQQESAELWASGATAVIQRLEHTNRMVNELCRAASAALQCLVSCSLYMSRHGGMSFTWHTDAWRVLAIQLHGAKTFHIRADAVESFPLTPGSWLRIDPHESHMATADSELSVHLSFGAH